MRSPLLARLQGPLRSPAASRRAARIRSPRVVTGRDVAKATPPRWQPAGIRLGTLLVVASGAVCAALGLVALRMDSVRLRYALADAVRAEQQLLDEQRSLTVEMRQLRDPRRLQALGQELGLGPASCLIDLDQPRPCPFSAHAAGELQP